MKPLLVVALVLTAVAATQLVEANEVRAAEPAATPAVAHPKDSSARVNVRAAEHSRIRSVRQPSTAAIIGGSGHAPPAAARPARALA